MSKRKQDVRKKYFEKLKKLKPSDIPIFLNGPMSPEDYRELAKNPQTREDILQVIGWVGVCPICFELIEGKLMDPNKLDIRKCRQTSPNTKCHVVGKRCRDVELETSVIKRFLKFDDTTLGKKIKCKNLPRMLGRWDDLTSARWHFLDKYAYQQRKNVKGDKIYCSEKCKKRAESRRYYKRKKIKLSCQIP